MTPENWKQTATESDIQKNVIRWRDAWAIKYPELALLFHIPSGGTRDIREANHLKAMGSPRGFPDLFLPCAKGNYHGLMIELKRIGGRLSKEQQWWLNELNRYNYYAKVAYGLDEAINTIKWYLELKGGNDDNDKRC